ncbi:hypothetical protein GCM10008927_22760 [Amylibacter ulvae]|uniref:Uncharacterized protein n=1 Tax=Paramylibacter ulvae TaxID=1651968 RepID=A0ABQ3D410_9RHOB|nr:hypothetical protein [Amylibacter ulvae]GHA56447.1 hypothetical protein GCM10008927_22760 [Amylibacter ulvae]
MEAILNNKIIRIGAAISAIWVFGVIAFFIFAPLQNGMDFISLVGIVLPLVVIWSAVLIAAAAKEIRDETYALRNEMQDIRNAALRQGTPPSLTQDFEVRQQLDQIADLTRRNDSRMSAIAAKTLGETGHPAPPRQTPALNTRKIPTADDLNQGDLPLPLSNEDGRVPISIPEFIKALNFPDDAKDREGFRVLRRALEDYRTAPLISSAKDLLTLLSEDGIYMDDFKPDRAKPDLWRQFANGKRGKTVEALGGIRDESALALANGRLKNDPNFREIAHVFMQQFVTVFEEFEKNAEDGELIAMSETRSAMCFMLLGRVSGTFTNT